MTEDINALSLARFLSGELPPEEMARVQRALERDSRLRKLVEESSLARRDMDLKAVMQRIEGIQGQREQRIEPSTLQRFRQWFQRPAPVVAFGAIAVILTTVTTRILLPEDPQTQSYTPKGVAPIELWADGRKLLADEPAYLEKAPVIKLKVLSPATSYLQLWLRDSEGRLEPIIAPSLRIDAGSEWRWLEGEYPSPSRTGRLLLLQSRQPLTEEHGREALLDKMPSEGLSRQSYDLEAAR